MYIFFVNYLLKKTTPYSVDQHVILIGSDAADRSNFYNILFGYFILFFQG